MTTTITVNAHAGRPVRVTQLEKRFGALQQAFAIVEPNTERAFAAWEGRDLWIHEIQPGENVIQASDFVRAESDDRIANNAVRHEYRRLSEAEKQQTVALKDKGAELLALIALLGKSRELSIAATNVEQAVMWAVKHVTR